jgi:hypothetical protein
MSEHHMVYVLYPFVTYLLALPRTSDQITKVVNILF